MRTHSLFLASLLLTGLPGLASADELQKDKFNADNGPSEQATLYLGTVAVGGKREIYEALQDIKLALDQPLSNDPKLADVVVCRLSDDIGTRAKQLLVCGTNRVLSQNKELLQTVMQSKLGDQPAGGDGHGGGSTACSTGACYENTISILNESLNNMRRHYLKQQVNGASLHALLASIPYPTGVQVVPAAATSVAPAAVTAHV